jgi:hypothetical protein
MAAGTLSMNSGCDYRGTGTFTINTSGTITFDTTNPISFLSFWWRTDYKFDLRNSCSDWFNI